MLRVLLYRETEKGGTNLKRGKDRKHMKEKISHPAFLKEKEENHGWL